MKYLHIIFFTIFFICANLYAQEQDTIITDIEESSILDADIEQKKVNNKKEENISDLEKDEKNDIPLEYIIPTYDKLSGFTVGWSINQPVYAGHRFELEKYKPIFGIMISSPITITLSRFTIGLGLGIESGNEKSTIYGTVNMKLFGKFSLIGGVGAMNDDGVHFGAGFEIDAPNVPISIKPFVRGNGSFAKKNKEAPESIFFNTLPFLGWVQAGVVIGYKL